jgi:hypothetical protein
MVASPLRGCARVVLCLAAVACATPARAQILESVGVRAQGMAGAFVAVADDVTATYWNPAGLVNAPLVDFTIQRSTVRDRFDLAVPVPPDGGWRTTTTFAGFSFPSLGVSYVHSTTDQAAAPTGSPAIDRQDDRPGMASVSRLTTDQLGLTLLQSVIGQLVVGTTLKLVRGGFQATMASGESLEFAVTQVEGVAGASATRFDFDIGALGWVGPLRLGFVAKSLLQPQFGAGGLPRQVRLGIALTPGFVLGRSAADRPSLTVAFDADLTRTTLVTGEERDVAAGVERWLGTRAALRAGVRANTVGDRRALVTAGGSVHVRANLAIDAHIGRGLAAGSWAAAGQTWGVAARVSF